MQRFNYDNDFKKEFLEIIDTETGEDYVERYTDIFNRVARTENYFEKDLYDFTSYEVHQFLYSYKSTDVYGMFLISSLIYKYQLLAFNKHKTSIAPKKFQFVDMQTVLDEFKIFTKYLTYNEYMQLLHNLENAQDKAAIVLAWNGILGVGLKDILNLKVSDVDFENNIINYRGVDREHHTHILKEWEVDILRDAIVQEKYTTIKLENVELRANLTEEEKEKKLENKETRVWGDIFATPYILRKVGKYEDINMSENPFTYAGLRTRFQAIKRMSLEDNISLKSIQDSGLAYRAIQDDQLNSTNIEIKEYIEKNKLYISPYNLKKLISVISKKIKKEKGEMN